MLKDKLIEYRDLTRVLIEALEKDVLNELEDNFNKRQKIIDDINNLDYTCEQFKCASQEINLIQLEENLKQLLNLKKQAIKEKMNNVRKSRNAHNAYNKKFINNSFFIKKTV